MGIRIGRRVGSRDNFLGHGDECSRDNLVDDLGEVSNDQASTSMSEDVGIGRQSRAAPAWHRVVDIVFFS